MKPFTNFESRIVPLAINNIDTDQIIPARFLKTDLEAGARPAAFQRLALRRAGRAQAGFHSQSAAGSRERRCCWRATISAAAARASTRPWALTQFGFRAVISTSFADIFKQNSLKNSLLPIVVPPDVHAELFAAVAADPDATVKIDLAAQTLTTPGGRAVEFPVDGFSKHCLLEAWTNWATSCSTKRPSRRMKRGGWDPSIRGHSQVSKWGRPRSREGPRLRRFSERGRILTVGLLVPCDAWRLAAIRT